LFNNQSRFAGSISQSEKIMNLNNALVKAYEGKSLKEVLDSP